METNQMNKDVEIGVLPFTWRDVMRTFEVGQEKKFPTNGPTMVLAVRGAICRYQNDTGTQFTTNVDEEGYIHIRRIK